MSDAQKPDFEPREVGENHAPTTQNHDERELLCRNIAWSLRNLRQERGISSREVAERTRLSRTSISAYEAGRALPGALELVRLSHALGVGVESLLGGPEPRRLASAPVLRVSPTANLAIHDAGLPEKIATAAAHLARVEDLAGYQPTPTLAEIQREVGPRPGTGPLRRLAEDLLARPGMAPGNLSCARMAESAGATCAFVAPGFGVTDALGLLLGERPMILIREPDPTQGCVEAAIEGVFRELSHLILHPREFFPPRVTTRPPWADQLPQSNLEARFLGECLEVPGQALRHIWRVEGLEALDFEKVVILLKEHFHCRVRVILRRLRQERLKPLAQVAPSPVSSPVRVPTVRPRRKIRPLVNLGGVAGEPVHEEGSARYLLARLERLAVEQAALPPWSETGSTGAKSLSGNSEPHLEPYAIDAGRLETCCRIDRLLALACRKDPTVIAGVAALGHGPERVRSLERKWLGTPGKEVPPGAL